MTDTEPFALLLLLVATVAVIAVLSNRLTARVRVPRRPCFWAVRRWPSRCCRGWTLRLSVWSSAS